MFFLTNFKNPFEFSTITVTLRTIMKNNYTAPIYVNIWIKKARENTERKLMLTYLDNDCY